MKKCIMNVAKIFKSGHSQAIRLPKKFNIDAEEVSIRKLGKSLIIQPLPKRWKDVFDKISSISSDEILPQRKDLPLQKIVYFE
jgi:antitoxin VapB